MTTTLNATTSNGLVVTPDNSGQIAFQNNGTTELTVNAFGIGLGTAVPSSGTGITFPAVQDPSSNANTLDDYEEGTWTPSLGGNATYTGRVASYTKVGNLVYVHCSINVSSIGTGSATTLFGLPFASKNTGTVQAAYVCYYVNIANSATWVSGYVENNGTTMQFTGNTSTATTIQYNGFNIFTNSTLLIFSACYIAN